jgi:hypothetical protein
LLGNWAVEAPISEKDIHGALATLLDHIAWLEERVAQLEWQAKRGTP